MSHFDNVDGGIRDVVEWHAVHANESAWMERLESTFAC